MEFVLFVFSLGCMMNLSSFETALNIIEYTGAEYVSDELICTSLTCFLDFNENIGYTQFGSSAYCLLGVRLAILFYALNP